MHKDNLEEHNYTTTDTCDHCKKIKEGTMLHAHDAMGMATPVLFLCDRCYKPTRLEHFIDECKRRPRRAWVLIRYYWNTTRAERAERKAKIAAIRARRVATTVDS